MEFQKELQALYEKAVQSKAQGNLAESESFEAQAAQILQQLKQRVEESPEEPETATLLLYLAEREWPLLGDHPDVLAKIQQALALREKHYGPTHELTAEALSKLAEFHYLSGRFAAAEPLYRRSFPYYPKAAEGLAHTLAALGRREEADPFFARAIEQVPDDAQGKRSLYFLLIDRADVLEKLERRPEAEILRQKAAALLPQSNPGALGYHVS